MARHTIFIVSQNFANTSITGPALARPWSMVSPPCRIKEAVMRSFGTATSSVALPGMQFSATPIESVADLGRLLIPRDQIDVLIAAGLSEEVSGPVIPNESTVLTQMAVAPTKDPTAIATGVQS